MPKIEALTGNESVAEAVRLCSPDLIAAYPITPQSKIVEDLASMKARGVIKSKIVDVESEYGAMSVLRGAAIVGKRLFTATCGQGLALMYEPYFAFSTMRFPMVMVITNREMISPGTIWSGQQDSMSVRDCGWMQMYCENNQEIIDSVIQAYNISENTDVMIPINVCYDGFYLSHQIERLEIPDQEQVDEFLPKYQGENLLALDKGYVVDPNTTGDQLILCRENHLESMEYAKKVIEATNNEFAKIFGRDHGGLISEYRNDDAEATLVTIGGMTGAAREAVDILRKKGYKVGLLKVRFTRPFPHEAIAEALKGKKAFGVFDRSVSFGWNTGILYQEVLAAAEKHGLVIPSIPFIGGLGGVDITVEHMTEALKAVLEVAEKQISRPVMWFTK